MSVEMRALNAISGSHLLLCGRSVAYVGHVRSRCLFSLWSAGRLVPLRGRAESHDSCSRTSAPLRLRTDLLLLLCAPFILILIAVGPLRP